QVVAASAAVAAVPPMSALRPAAGQRQRETSRLEISQDSPFRIVAAGVATSSGLYTVLVAESMDMPDDGTEAILGGLLVGMPLLAFAVGGATFLFVGRTLRPVEAMRRQAATITAKNLHTRLPMPTGSDEIA